MARPVRVGDPAPNPAVLEGPGREVPLSGSWRDRPAVLAFLRHFG
ncbi:MAG TPA: hypothetical protein VG602_09305 [Actinomycetota bacterium]|nr:hypothetical protein [Actinomycetota bacterium]